MTSEEKNYEQKKYELLEEVCENTRAIRRVVNRILDHLHEYAGDDDENTNDYDPDSISWRDLDNGDDMYM